MSTAKTVAAAPAAEQTPPAATPAPAAAAPAATVDNTAAIAEAVKADRARCKAIAELPEAKGREKLAASLAEKGMSVDEAKELLAAAPKASGLDNLMEQNGTPGISGEEVAGASVKQIPIATAAETYEFRKGIFSGKNK